MWYSTSQARVYSASLHVKTMLTWSARPIDVDSIYFFSVQCMVTVFTGHLRSVHVHGHRPYTRTITFEQNNLWPRYIFDSLVHLHPIYVQYPGQGHGRSSRSQEEMLLKWSDATSSEGFSSATHATGQDEVGIQWPSRWLATHSENGPEAYMPTPCPSVPNVQLSSTASVLIVMLLYIGPRCGDSVYPVKD